MPIGFCTGLDYAGVVFPAMPFMPRVTFTANLHRHVNCPTTQVAGATVGEALAGVFNDHPLLLRGYVLDEQGAVRHHVVIFAAAFDLR